MTLSGTSFQAGLDAADLTILGRISHDATPNIRGRKRLVMQRSGLPLHHEDALTWYWNTQACSFNDVISELGFPVSHAAIAGGQVAFGHFLAGAHRFTTFYLSQIAGVTLPGGRKVFPGMGDGATAEDILRAAEYVAGPRTCFDATASVTPWSLMP